jgi:hypothetical protein
VPSDVKTARLTLAFIILAAATHQLLMSIKD